MMIRTSILFQTLVAQMIIFCMIVLKIIVIPFVIWRLLGTTEFASQISDIAVLILGTIGASTVGWIGYQQANSFAMSTHRWLKVYIYMLTVHIPLILFILQKLFFGATWDTFISLVLSGWLSIFTHPMILVGLYGAWIDILGLIAFCACYILGAWICFDEMALIHPQKNARLH